MKALAVVLSAPLLLVLPSGAQAATTPARAALEATTSALTTRYGASERGRIEQGARQVAAAWAREQGGAVDLSRFIREEFVPRGPALDGLFARFEEILEQLDGDFLAMNRALTRHRDLDLGPITSLDKRLAAFQPAAHLVDDLFATKIAHVALLNFPLTTLAQRLTEGEHWSRRQWAEARLAQRFAWQVPAAVQAKVQAAQSAANLYIAQYNLYMHHLVDSDGRRPFPRGLRLISHWNLRDELKAAYASHDLGKQRMIDRVLGRIVDQTIPQAVIDNPAVDWNPFTNAVAPSPAAEIDGPTTAAGKAAPSNAREPDTRYRELLDIFLAQHAADRYSPAEPTFIARRFDVDREIPEARFVVLMKSVLTSPLAPRMARLIESRLGRKLEDFDLWYDGFLPRAREAELDARVRRRYPTAKAYHDDIPRLLRRLGFSPARARYFAEHIVVDPARGAGHAMEAARRGDYPHLRTRIEPGGMDYKGYNIAVHEMGHNVEQVCSLYLVDHTLLRGVPNNAFTEALAFVFQRRDLELLGLGKPDAKSERLRLLTDFWQTFELAGVSLVDLGVWHWMYAHPEATPAELRAATVEISKEIWNRYYAPIFGVKDSLLLGVYSHMISEMLYLPDYPIGHLIAAQIEEHLRSHGPLGAEFERMASFGRVTPDLWMEHATGQRLSAEPLLRMTEAALRVEEGGTRAKQ